MKSSISRRSSTDKGIRVSKKTNTTRKSTSALSVMKSNTRDASTKALLERLRSTEAMLDAARDTNLRLQEERDRIQKENRVRIDVAALDAIDDVSGLGIADAKIRALKQLQVQKTKALMQTIQKLEKELKHVKASNREHRRTKQIKSLMIQVKDSELVTDELKKYMMQRNLFDHQKDLNEYIIKKTLAGPKRFRPASREELQNQITSLQAKLESSKKKNTNLNVDSGSVASRRSVASRYRDTHSRAGSTIYEESKHDSHNRDLSPPSIPTLHTMSSNSNKEESKDQIQHISKLMLEVDELTVNLKARERSLRNYKDQVEELHDEVHRLRSFEEKWKRAESKYKTIREQLEATEKDGIMFQQMKQKWEEDKTRLEAEKQWVDDESHRMNEEHMSKQLGLLEKIHNSQAKQLEAEQTLETFQRERASERQGQLNSSTGTKHLSSTLADTLKQEQKLRHRCETQISVLQNEVGRLKTAVEVSSTKLSQTRRAASSLQAVLDTKKDLELETATLRNKIIELRNQNNEGNKLNSELFELKIDCKVLEKELASQSKLTGMEKDNLTDKLSNLQDQVASLRSELENEKSENKELRENHTATKANNNNNSSNNNNNSGRVNDSAAMLNDNEQQQKTKEILQSRDYEINKLKSDIMKLETDIDDLLSEVDILKEEKEHLIQSNDNLSKMKLPQKMKLVDSSSSSKNTTISGVVEAEVEHSDVKMGGKLQDLRIRCDDAIASEIEARQDCNVLRAKLREYKVTIGTLTKRLEGSRATSISSSKKLENLMSAVSSYEKEILNISKKVKVSDLPKVASFIDKKISSEFQIMYEEELSSHRKLKDQMESLKRSMDVFKTGAKRYQEYGELLSDRLEDLGYDPPLAPDLEGIAQDMFTDEANDYDSLSDDDNDDEDGEMTPPTTRTTTTK